MTVTEQQVRNIASLHTGKMHEALIRELDARVVERLEAQRQQIEHLHAVVETIRRVIMGVPSPSGGGDSAT